MRRTGSLVVAALVLLMALTASAATLPVLAGPWSGDQQGYGRARPSTIFNGGDASGLLDHIHWLTWGGAKAIGEGSGLYIAPNQHSFQGTRQPARVVLFQLGYCHGKRAYEAIEWYFPQHGQHFSPTNYIAACTGKYHGEG